MGLRVGQGWEQRASRNQHLRSNIEESINIILLWLVYAPSGRLVVFYFTVAAER